jgi:RimJ/RimL family protein N-acetyltransferase
MIRPAKKDDFPEILSVYAAARAFMKKTGNPNQWGDSYPTEAMLRRDMAQNNLYIEEREGRIQAVFAFIPGEDPTYRFIEGKWLNDAPYAAVHRVASRGEIRGLATEILSWCLQRCPNIRIDTHDDNRPMQRVLAKNGFTFCGRIFLENGDPRVAYQKSI